MFPLLAGAQVIDNAASYRNMGTDKYFRFHYENDYFSTTDIYYTQGVNFEFVHPALAKTGLPKILIHSNVATTKYGISVEHLAYTPTSITHTEILQRDRPFAAALFLKPFAITNDSRSHRRMVSALSVGVIGATAGGRQIQETIHGWINGTPPKGWNNQIHNDLILNYQFDFEQRIAAYGYLLLTAKAGAHVGTLSDKVYTSITLMGGLFDDPFNYFARGNRKFQVYVYAEPQLNAIGYDATLQGGMLNRQSPYTLPYRDITRLVFQGNTGLVVKVNRFTIEYFQSFLSKEFRTGGTHHWGGIRLGWNLRP